MAHALEVERLSKLYRLGEVGTGTLSHDLNQWWHKLRGKPNPYAKVGEANDRAANSDNAYVWALRDINFNVEEGEVLGIVGHNGAGKSTLLKVLSRVTGPTEGEVRGRGRIASLLEVGTGFHPEMTGRENIYMNGTIMGMTRREIDRKLEEIVDFAGVARYLDTPVKRYSSGMMVRLGFAVAAHLEPEILVLDEVLAVGDAEFQKKAIGKMKDVSRSSGRTVLFVSHNMGAVNTLCNRAILLEKGQMLSEGTAQEITHRYLQGRVEQFGALVEWSSADAPGDEMVRLDRVRILGENRDKIEFLDVRHCAYIELEYRILDANCNPIPNYHLYSSEGFKIATLVDPAKNRNYGTGRYRSTLQIPAHFFNEGDFILGVALSSMAPLQIHYQDQQLLPFRVVDNLESPTRNEYKGSFQGALRPMMEWGLERTSEL